MKYSQPAADVGNVSHWIACKGTKIHLLTIGHGSVLRGEPLPSITSTNLTPHGLHFPVRAQAMPFRDLNLIKTDLQRCTISLSRTYWRQSPDFISMFWTLSDLPFGATTLICLSAYSVGVVRSAGLLLTSCSDHAS